MSFDKLHDYYVSIKINWLRHGKPIIIQCLVNLISFLLNYVLNIAKL